MMMIRAKPDKESPTKPDKQQFRNYILLRTKDDANWFAQKMRTSQVDVESTVESERSSDGRHDLSNQTVEVGVSWSLDVEVATTDVVDGLVIDHEGTIGMLQGCVGGQDGVVWFNNCGGNL